MAHETPSERTETVATPERRRVIAGLADGTVETVADLQVRGRADEIAAKLRETHLPALEEAGYIEWNREEGTINPGPNFEGGRPTSPTSRIRTANRPTTESAGGRLSRPPGGPSWPARAPSWVDCARDVYKPRRASPDILWPSRF